MFPGTYRTAFVPTMTITINRLVDLDCVPGYRCRGSIDVNLAHWLDLEFGDEHGAELHVMGIEKVFASPCCDKLIDPPDDLVNWITRQPGVRLRDLVPVVIGGINGTRLDFEADRVVHFGSTGRADLPCCGIGPKTRTWLNVLKVENHWVLIMEVFGPENTVHDFSAVVRGLQPIVDSIVWN